jgi:hypothetical protein
MIKKQMVEIEILFDWLHSNAVTVYGAILMGRMDGAF